MFQYRQRSLSARDGPPARNGHSRRTRCGPDSPSPAVFDGKSPACAFGRWRRTGARVLGLRDRKSTRLNSSHGYISYAVFCLKKKKHEQHDHQRLIGTRRMITPSSTCISFINLFNVRYICYIITPHNLESLMISYSTIYTSVK